MPDDVYNSTPGHS